MRTLNFPSFAEMRAKRKLSHGAEFAFNPDQDRDDHGRWTSGDGAAPGEDRRLPGAKNWGRVEGPMVLTRDQGDGTLNSGRTHIGEATNAKTAERNSAVVTEALSKAEEYKAEFLDGPGRGAGYERELTGLESMKGEETVLGDTTHWVPGSAEALAESVYEWQKSYENSRNITAAADEMLQGLRSGIGYENADAGHARELLNALGGEVPDGVISENAAMAENQDYAPEVQLEHFGSNDALVRGVADPEGTILDTFRAAKADDREVSWSVAAFAMQTAGDSEVFGGVGDPYEHISSDAIAIKHANDSGGENPVLITLASSEGLNIDGGYEALTGGTFKVDSIAKDKVWTGQIDEYGGHIVQGEEVTKEDDAFYKREEVAGFYTAVTRVTLTQTATPKGVG